MARSVWLQFVILFLYLVYGLCDDETYVAGFSQGAEGCKGFDNDFLNLGDLYLTPIEDEEYEGAGLMAITGQMVLGRDLDSGVMLGLDIVKKTDNGEDPMFSTSMDLCEAIKDKDAPWASAFKAMHIEDCPVEAGTRDVDDVLIDLGFCADFLNHQYCGEYKVAVKLLDQQQNELTCYNMGISVVEV